MKNFTFMVFAVLVYIALHFTPTHHAQDIQTPQSAAAVAVEQTNTVYGIKVTGEPWAKERVKAALDLLAAKDPEGYKLVVESVKEVSTKPEAEMRKGVIAQALLGSGVVEYSDYMLKNEDIEAVAAMLVHEATHLKLCTADEAPAWENAKKTFQRLTASR